VEHPGILPDVTQELFRRLDGQNANRDVVVHLGMDFACGVKEQRRRAAFPRAAVIGFPVSAFEDESEKRCRVRMSRNDKGREIGILDERNTRNGSAPSPFPIIPPGRQDRQHVQSPVSPTYFKEAFKLRRTELKINTMDRAGLPGMPQVIWATRA